MIRGGAVTDSSLGEQFVRAFAAKDAQRLRGIFAEDLSFRGMTPDDFWEATTAAAAIDEILFAMWLEPHERIYEIVSTEHDVVLGRQRVGYRLLMERPDGRYVIDQQAYYEVRDGRIAWLRVMCCGLQPAP